MPSLNKMPTKKTAKIKKSADLVRCLWGLVCTAASIDQDRHNLTLFNVIDQINIPESEFKKINKEVTRINAILPHEIVLVWRTLMNEALNDGISFKLKVKLIGPEGIVLGEHLVPMDIPPKIRRYRFRIQLNAIQITTPGDYCYQIEIMQRPGESFDLAQEIPLEVVAREGK